MDLVVFAACVQTLEIICDLKCLVNIRRITQLGKGFYNIELAVCKNILAPAAADNKAIFLTGLLDDGVCIMQNCTVIRSAESTIAQKQDIADLFDFLMGLYEAILQSRRSRQQRVHDLLTLFREGAHCLHAALRSAQFGHRDHLHSLGYLLGVLHAFYSRANGAHISH